MARLKTPESIYAVATVKQWFWSENGRTLNHDDDIWHGVLHRGDCPQFGDPDWTKRPSVTSVELSQVEWMERFLPQFICTTCRFAR
jgi:hypothetical protein